MASARSSSGSRCHSESPVAGIFTVGFLLIASARVDSLWVMLAPLFHRLDHISTLIYSAITVRFVCGFRSGDIIDDHCMSASRTPRTTPSFRWSAPRLPKYGAAPAITDHDYRRGRAPPSRKNFEEGRVCLKSSRRRCSAGSGPGW